MLNNDDIEIKIKVLDRETAMGNYKHDLLRLMIKFENSQLAFTPKLFKHEPYTKSTYIKEFGSIESQIDLLFDSKGILVVLIDNAINKVVGYTIAMFHDESLTTTSASIWYLYIDDKYRGMGLSKSLLNAIIKEIKESKEKILSIQVMHFVSNRHAGHIYKSMGFIDMNVVKCLSF